MDKTVIIDEPLAPIASRQAAIAANKACGEESAKVQKVQSKFSRTEGEKIVQMRHLKEASKDL